MLVCGVDEAGRGAWAGNVTAAAVILPPDYDLPGLTDSKKLSPKKRCRLYTAIMAQALCVRYAQMNAAAIDAMNIYQATLAAMRGAVCALPIAPDKVLIDGNAVPPHMPYPAQAVIGGDSAEPAIAAASIIAKVTRDRQLLALDKLYPQYQFAAHKGYGTAAHQHALSTYGVSPLHRRSYAPIRRLLEMGLEAGHLSR